MHADVRVELAGAVALTGSISAKEQILALWYTSASPTGPPSECLLVRDLECRFSQPSVFNLLGT